MAGKHYVIATQSGYIVDKVTGYPEEFATRAAAVKAMADLVRDAAESCRRSHKTCSVVGTARGGDVQIRVGGRQGYHLWDRYTISERPGSRKPAKESKLLRDLRAAAKPVHATRKKSGAQLDREIAEALGSKRGRHHATKSSDWPHNVQVGDEVYAVSGGRRHGPGIVEEIYDDGTMRVDFTRQFAGRLRIRPQDLVHVA
jgi:hypothetical protein